MITKIENSPYPDEETREIEFALARIAEAIENLWLGSIETVIIQAAQEEYLSNYDDHRD